MGRKCFLKLFSYSLFGNTAKALELTPSRCSGDTESNPWSSWMLTSTDCNILSAKMTSFSTSIRAEHLIVLVGSLQTKSISWFLCTTGTIKLPLLRILQVAGTRWNARTVEVARHGQASIYWQSSLRSSSNKVFPCLWGRINIQLLSEPIVSSFLLSLPPPPRKEGKWRGW